MKLSDSLKNHPNGCFYQGNYLIFLLHKIKKQKVRLVAINIFSSYDLRDIAPLLTQRKRKKEVDLCQHFKNMTLTIPMARDRG